jgi:CotH protein/chitobiase/beta-hexosaminidase-like protein/lamin tail-like protein
VQTAPDGREAAGLFFSSEVEDPISACLTGTMRAFIVLLLLALLSPGALAVDIFIDNDDGAPGYTETGSWTTTTNTGVGYDGGLYRYTNDTREYSTATWTFAVPSDGFYEVSTIFRASGDRTSDAPHTVHDADGSSITHVDQTGSFSGPLIETSLGLHRFEAGLPGSVVLSNDGGVGAYIADAIHIRSDPPPEISQMLHAPLYPQAGESITVTGRITDNTSIDQVVLHMSALPSGTAVSAEAFDDGAHGDGGAGDSVYGTTAPGFADGEVLTAAFEAFDDLGNSAMGSSLEITVGVEASWELRINEVLASNGVTSFDPDFIETGDWVEIFNFGPDAADLTGLALSDDPANPAKWLFPLGSSIPAGQYAIIWCDDHDLVGLAMHTNFRLSSAGEDVVLWATGTGSALDQIAFPALDTDESYARLPDLGATWAATTIPTPGAINQMGMRGDPPVFSVASGLFTGPLTVEVTAPGAIAIRFTTDGSEPTAASTAYSSPLLISSTTGLRARAFYSDRDPSHVTSASYFFDIIADRTIPVMNLIIDPDDLFDPATGIHANPSQRGMAWERPVHAVITSTDGSVIHEVEAGIRIHGGTTRGADKKSFRLYMRSIYGPRDWSLSWLERSDADAVEQLVLRAGGNEVFTNTRTEITYLRDQTMRDLLADSGHVAADGFFVALYLNGEYWGLYNVTERITNDLMEEIHGGEDWDIVKGSWEWSVKYFTEAPDGDLLAWNEFLAWHESHDLATGPDFAELQARIDYPNFMDWFSLNIACQNEDWPHNNWIAARRRGDPTARWTFHEWDAEWPLGHRPEGWTSDTLVWAQGDNYHLSPSHNGTIAPLCQLFNGNDLDPGRTTDINGVLDHSQGRLDFIQAMEDMLNFTLNPDRAIGEWDVLAELIETEIPREAQRWTPSSAATEIAQWWTSIQNVRDFFTYRPAVMRGLMIAEFGLAGTREIAFQAAGGGSGRLEVNGRVVDLPWTGIFFDGSDIDLSAIADPGSLFSGWSGGISGVAPDLIHTTTVGPTSTVTLTFATDASGPQPNDVIFNELWINDDSTVYPIVGMIEGDWIELLVARPGVDLRGWRLTNNRTVAEHGTVDDGEGSLIFPDDSGLASLARGTIVLVVTSVNVTNEASFPTDDLDPSDGRVVLYRGNGNLDDTTDPGFSLRPDDEALALLAPGSSASFADDITVDFVAEGTAVTPASFTSPLTPQFVFVNPFEGLGNNDGAVFLNGPAGSLINDDGSDPTRTDFEAGPGGWVVDPPAEFTGDMPGVNLLTPGALNTGQVIPSLMVTTGVSLR